MKLQADYAGEDGYIGGEYLRRCAAPSGKTAFLEDGRRLLKHVAKLLAPHGFALYGKVTVNPGGPAVSGEVTARYWHVAERVGAKLTVLASGVHLEGPARRDNVVLLALRESAPRKNDGANVWWRADLDSLEISVRLLTLTGICPPRALGASPSLMPGWIGPGTRSAGYGQNTLFDALVAGIAPASASPWPMPATGIGPMRRIRASGGRAELKALLDGLDTSSSERGDNAQWIERLVTRYVHDILVERARGLNNALRSINQNATVRLAIWQDDAWCEYANL